MVRISTQNTLLDLWICSAAATLQLNSTFRNSWSPQNNPRPPPILVLFEELQVVFQPSKCFKSCSSPLAVDSHIIAACISAAMFQPPDFCESCFRPFSLPWVMFQSTYYCKPCFRPSSIIQVMLQPPYLYCSKSLSFHLPYDWQPYSSLNYVGVHVMIYRHLSDHSRGLGKPSATICFLALTCNAGKGGSFENSSALQRRSALFKYLPTKHLHPNNINNRTTTNSICHKK